MVPAPEHGKGETKMMKKLMLTAAFAGVVMVLAAGCCLFGKDCCDSGKKCDAKTVACPADKPACPAKMDAPAK